MKIIKLINLLVLVLFCQVVFSQNNGIVKSFNLRMDEPAKQGLDSSNIAKILKNQLKIPPKLQIGRAHV